MRLLPLLPLALVLLLCGCREDLEVAPAYVIVEDIRLDTPGLPGSTGAISEVWAFADGEFVGAFRLPARIPVFAVGQTELRFEAGVRRNGISATPEIYPFYAPVSRSVELRPAESTNLGVLSTGYRSEANFGFVEGFEPGNDAVFTEPLIGVTPLVPSMEAARTGEFSGKLLLTRDDPLVELATSLNINGFSAARPNMWLEVDFLSEAPVAWGITGSVGGESFKAFDPTFAPRDEWTKIYFDLSELLAASNLEELEVYFSAPLLQGEERATVYLDNLRLLYF